VSHRILVVDDNHDVADGLVRVLKVLSYDAKPIYDPHEAVEHAAQFEPDMAFIDIGMPGLDGYEVVKRIRQQRQNIHVILIAHTGWSRGTDKQRAYDAGFDLHVAKPMSVETLKELLTLLEPPRGESRAAQVHRLAARMDGPR
jgi:CheY-like chemotaxis protein